MMIHDSMPCLVSRPAGHANNCSSSNDDSDDDSMPCLALPHVASAAPMIIHHPRTNLQLMMMASTTMIPGLPFPTNMQ
jgi:hypothetical protein